ncbi:CRISPR-associated endonuclease Cas1 [Marinobacterium stanieri]|uniref:CRISPR-associated endonuclease Cas1 n=1 Tax=Marinobacterium stanieri TaxID=49186 RepID=UPI003A94B504
MTHIIIDRHQVTLEYATDCMIVRVPDELPRTIPLGRVDQLVCLHSVHLTTQLIGQLHKRGIDLIVLNMRYENSSFALFADQQRQVERRCRQYRWQQDDADRLQFARALCSHKFKVMTQLLSDFHTMPALSTCERLQQARQVVSSCRSEDELRGIEGSLQRMAFDIWRQQLPASLGFVRRERRPPKDPVNAVLSLTYTLVHQDAVRQAKRYGLDPQLGFYHRTAFGRQSLACDLMEPVRPHVESWVVRLFNEGVLNKRNFTQSSQSCLLGKTGRTEFYAAFDEAAQQWRRKLAAGAHWLARRIDQPGAC